jgi:hypothetical protein
MAEWGFHFIYGVHGFSTLNCLAAHLEKKFGAYELYRDSERHLRTF